MPPKRGGKDYKTPSKGDVAARIICSLLGKAWSQFILQGAGSGVREM